MAGNSKKDQATKRQLKDWLGQLGLHGDYLALIDAAVRHDWGTGQFTQRLVRTESFQRTFPGLIEHNGSIANFLTGQEGAPVSPTVLGSAIRNYRSLSNSYEQAAKLYGYNWKPNMMQNAIKNQTSPQEFQSRLAAIHTVNTTPGLHDFFAQAVKANGVHGVDTQREIFRLAAGVSEKKFENIYETARLSQAGIGFSPKQAAALAKQIGNPAEQVDIGKLVSDVRQNISFIGPELQNAGISNAQLTKFLANPTGDPNLATKLNQIVAARKSIGASYVPGMQTRKGSGGGLAQYQEEGAAAY